MPVDQEKLSQLVRELIEKQHACGPDCICYELRPLVGLQPVPALPRV